MKKLIIGMLMLTTMTAQAQNLFGEDAMEAGCIKSVDYIKENSYWMDRLIKNEFDFIGAEWSFTERFRKLTEQDLLSLEKAGVSREEIIIYLKREGARTVSSAIYANEMLKKDKINPYVLFDIGLCVYLPQSTFEELNIKWTDKIIVLYRRLLKHENHVSSLRILNRLQKSIPGHYQDLVYKAYMDYIEARDNGMSPEAAEKFLNQSFN